MRINDLSRAAHEAAVKSGWYDTKRNIPELLVLIHSEISEALECYREDRMRTYTVSHKPCGFWTEIADVYIRLGDMCGFYGIDIERVIERKMAYNSTREYRHGGKRI